MILGNVFFLKKKEGSLCIFCMQSLCFLLLIKKWNNTNLALKDKDEFHVV